MLPRAVASARNAGRKVEIIIVDDASTDDTASVCRALEGIKYIRLEQNQGVAGARNVGLLASSSDYIAFLDDDDLRMPGSLDVQTGALSLQSKAGWCCGSILYADQSGELTGETSPQSEGGDVFWQLLELNFPVMPISVVIRKDCFFQVGLFRRNLAGIDDWDLFVRLAELYPVISLAEPVGTYRQPTPVSGQGSSAQARHLTRAARHQWQLLKLPRAAEASAARRRDVRRRTVNRIADTLLWNAARRLPEGAYRFAYANALAALRLNPLRAVRPMAYKRLCQRLLAH
jgi:glycosyltransferase involved in cell wall biosynthesis